MKLWVSSYSKILYEIILNRKCTKIKEIKKINLKSYPSYIYKFKNHVAIALKENEEQSCSGVTIYNRKNQSFNDYYMSFSFTHVYMDKEYILAGSYHQGAICILNRENNKIILHKYKNSKIHNAGRIRKDKYYAVDLENQKIYIFNILNGIFNELDTINVFDNKPRHLVVKGKWLYVLCEDTSKILCYKEQKNKYKKIQEITAVNDSKKNEAAAIKIKCRNLYCTNRGDNTINIYKIKKDGTLKKYINISSFGNNPRDLLPINKKLICVINKDSNNLVLLKMKKRMQKQ